MADSVTITSIDESEGAGPSTSTSGALSPATTALFEAPTAGPPLKTEALAGGSKTTSTDLLESSLHSTPSTSQLDSANTSPSPAAAEGAPEQTAEGGGGGTGEEEKKDDSIFECNICLDTAKDAVVSMCGHLFCWPCLHQWLETRPRRQLCPVCKAAISKEKVIPLYGRGSTNQQDPRTKVPPRPAGQRTEPETGGFQGFGLGDSGFHMSFGIGAFPLGYLTSSFNFDGRGRTAERGTAQFEEEQFLSKVFIWVAMIFLAWLVFVY